MASVTGSQTTDKPATDTKGENSLEEEQFSKLHKKFVEQNLRETRLSEEDIMIARVVDKASTLRWVDYLFPYHLLVSSRDNLVFVERSLPDIPNNINSYYRKRNALMWLFSKECTAALNKDEIKIRNDWEYYTFMWNIGFKWTSLVILFNSKFFKNFQTKALPKLIVDGFLLYFGVYAWILSNAAAYEYHFHKYSPLINKWRVYGCPINKEPHFDLTQMKLYKCKFYAYDPLL